MTEEGRKKDGLGAKALRFFGFGPDKAAGVEGAISRDTIKAIISDETKGIRQFGLALGLGLAWPVLAALWYLHSDLRQEQRQILAQIEKVSDKIDKSTKSLENKIEGSVKPRDDKVNEMQNKMHSIDGRLIRVEERDRVAVEKS